MSAGVSLFLIAVGAILRYAVSWHPSGVDIETVGLILMIVGGIGLLLSLWWMLIWTNRRREPPVPPAAPPPRGPDAY